MTISKATFMELGIKAGTKGIQHFSAIFWCSVVTPLKIYLPEDFFISILLHSKKYLIN